MDMQDYFKDLALESGAIVDGDQAEVLLTDVLGDQVVAATEPGAADQIQRAEDSADIAEQLDNLADRAEVLAEQQASDAGMPVEVAQMATESLHREYCTIMRANHMEDGFKATSFEAAGSEKERLQGIVKDARRTAKITRDYRDALMDFTTEGTIMRALRMDESRLATARSALKGGIAAMQKSIESLKATPVIVKHEGMARFLTQEDRPVLNLKEGIGREAAWLASAQGAVNDGLAQLLKAAQALRSNPNANVAGLLSGSVFNKINSLSTAKGALMGNYTVTSVNSGDAIVKYNRVDGFKFKPGTALNGVGWALLSRLGWGFTTAVAIGLGGMITGGAILPVVMAAAPVINVALNTKAAYDGVKSYQDTVNKSGAKSVASAADLKAALQAILDYEKYTNFRLDGDAINDTLAAAVDAGAAKKDAGLIEDALGRLITLADIIYEQATYTTVSAAQLAGYAAKAK